MKAGSFQNGSISFALVFGLLLAPVTRPVTSNGTDHARTSAVKTLAHSADNRVAVPPADKSQAHAPAYFEENQGQFDSEVRFIARAIDCSLFLTSKGAVYVISDGKGMSARQANVPESMSSSQDAVTRHALRMEFAGAGATKLSGAEELPGVVNYLKGNDAAQWHTNIRTYKKVQYENLYPGIDLVYYTRAHQLEYDLVAAPGADTGQIVLSFSGADSVSIDTAGDLVLKLGSQVLKHQKPQAYQEVNGARREVDCRYQLNQSGQVEFSLGAYDHSLPLTIDPVVLGYSTYLGGDQVDQITDIAVDNFGAVYVTGYTESNSFPTTAGAYQTSPAGSIDVFVTRFFPGSTVPEYSTYLGGGSDDFGKKIAVDASGNAYILGGTSSAGASPFPTTPGAFQTTHGGGTADCFVTKLNSTGTALIYSTYLGGGDNDNGDGIAIDNAGNAYIAGSAFSSVGLPFPTTPGVFQPTPPGGGDAFVTKLNPAGSALVFSTFLGGGSQDAATGVAVDTTGNVYVTGGTFSGGASPFPTTAGAFQTSKAGSRDAFVTKVKPDGSGLLYSTYIGGAGNDLARAIKINAAGNAYICGGTDSSGATPFPTTAGAFQITSAGNFDAFVTKLAPAGNALTYSTYLGGFDLDEAADLAIDTSGDAYVTGLTKSQGLLPFPTQNAFQPVLAGGQDVFVTRLNPNGTALLYSTYLGGGGDDFAFGIALDLSGLAYVAGVTESTNPAPFPTTADALQTTLKGTEDGFVAKLVPTFEVNVTGDAVDANLGDGICQTATPGNCSLRAAIQEANADTGVDKINFNIPGSGVKTISPTSALPQINDPVIIDGYSQPGATANTLAAGDDANILIQLSGNLAGATANGLRLSTFSSVIQGIAVNRFKGDGIQLVGSGGNVVSGCFIGTDAAGTTALGNGGFGISLSSNVNGIGGFTPSRRNVISGNGDSSNLDSGGVGILQGIQNGVAGNYIGTDKSGTTALPNSKGIRISGGTNDTIGGTSATARNLISGNSGSGIEIIGSATTNHLLRGNFIGTDVNGTAVLANGGNGVVISGGANTNTIGGTIFGAGNVISGNSGLGVFITSTGTTANSVEGNRIGTDASGAVALGNQTSGVLIGHADGNSVGGTTAGARNIISGNINGVFLDSANNTVIQGNFVGTNTNGTAAIPNTL